MNHVKYFLLNECLFYNLESLRLIVLAHLQRNCKYNFHRIFTVFIARYRRKHYEADMVQPLLPQFLYTVCVLKKVLSATCVLWDRKILFIKRVYMKERFSLEISCIVDWTSNLENWDFLKLFFYKWTFSRKVPFPNKQLFV